MSGVAVRLTGRKMSVRKCIEERIGLYKLVEWTVSNTKIIRMTGKRLTKK